MKKYILYAFLLMAGCAQLKAQRDKFDSIVKELKGFYAYKSSSDFFNKKRRALGQYAGSENDFQIVVDTKTKKKVKFKLQDSTFFAFKIEKGVNIMFKPQNSYGSFCGGTKNLYVVAYPPFPSCNYDSENYLYSFEYKGSPETLKWYFVKDPESKEMYSDIREVLKDEKDLLEKYLNAKNNTDSSDWEKNRIYTEIAYIKMYNQRKSQK